MADLAEIIANIDGYKRYESNRAVDLANQAQNLQNQQSAQIMDLKTQLANLQNNPYAKWGIWDPQGRHQQLLNEDQQLKIASKWATSIKNLAPEKRAQGYAQFLKAMPSLGIDVSDMPQGYDEAYINQVADLGIETETRYQNEQQNARQERQIAATQANLERQIAAQREARQDEFDKKLAAFDYENSYKTKVEKQKLDEKDAFVRGLGYDDDTTNSLLAANRGITTPGTDDIMLKRLNNNPQDAAARAYFQNKAEAAKFIKENEPVKPLTDKEKSEIGKNLGWTADPDVFNSEGKFEFKPKPQTGVNSVDEAVRKYDVLSEKFPDMSEQDKLKLAFGDTYTGAAYGAGLKAGAEAEATQPYLIERDNNASQNRITENVMGQYVGDKIKRGQMVLENDIKKDFESWKQNIPSEAVIDAQNRAEILQKQGFNVTAADILYNGFKKDVLGNLQTAAQIAQTKANTEKTQAETGVVGTTPQILNAEYLQQNPEMANSPIFTKTETDKGESELRKEFNGLTKDYRIIGDSYNKILKAAEKKSAAGDLSLIFNYMKILDPSSTVREGEFSNAENARAWFDKTGAPTAIQLAYNKAKNGQRLLDEQRKDFVDMAGLLMKAQKQSFESLGNRFKEIAEDAGYNPENVVIDPYANSINESMENPVIEVGGSKEYNNGFKIERVD